MDVIHQDCCFCLAHPPHTLSYTLSHTSTQFHFVCECFFMTAKALRLGVIKTMQQTESEAQLIGRLRVHATRVFML